jgi:hypothetical protein
MEPIAVAHPQSFGCQGLEFHLLGIHGHPII